MSPLATAILCTLALTVGIAALVPSRARRWVRTALVFVVILAPVIALVAAIACYAPRTEPGTWLLFLPLTFVYLASLDLRWGVSARLARGIGADARRSRDRV